MNKSSSEEVKEEIEALLSTDSFGAAQQLFPNDHLAAQDLGMMFTLENSRAKREVLTAADDTTFDNDLIRYLRIVKEEGFIRLLEIQFVAESGDEVFYVMFHQRDGILLVFDTCHRWRVNGGYFYYNWKPGESESGKDWHRALSSYSLGADNTFAGYHDCRMALRFHLARLREHGTFVSPWVEQPFLWLLHHGDTEVEGYNADHIARERLALLPAEVRAAILALDPIETA